MELLMADLFNWIEEAEVGVMVKNITSGETKIISTPIEYINKLNENIHKIYIQEAMDFIEEVEGVYLELKNSDILYISYV